MREQNVLFEEYEPIKDILRIGQYALVKYEKKPKERGITNERQAILKEIIDIMEKESPVNKKLLAIKLSHIPTEDFYFIKSEGLDYRKRTGQPFGKYIYGSIKPKLDK